MDGSHGAPRNPEKEVPFDQDFFQIQIEFARAAAELQGIPFETVLENALLKYTSVYNFIGERGRGSGPLKEAYDEFTERARPYAAEGKYAEHNERNDREIARIAHEMYMDQRSRSKVENEERQFGCFSYRIYRSENTDEQKKISIHFKNRDSKGGGPLSSGKIASRQRDLYEMFKEIRRLHPTDDYLVTGESWLYNEPKYRALFPEEYQASLDNPENVAPIRQLLWGLIVWGQFLKADGTVDPKRRKEFSDRVAKARNLTELLNAFPLKVLTPRAPVSVFYKMVDEYERSHSQIA